ncbi:MAG TPA: sigma-70 region 4 domain-containing protein, partial [Solirubrobacteraceae bacterium]|nr:sigma-70 region 4 domain-containing protein [Solirubrobacteraceae bacterium]
MSRLDELPPDQHAVLSLLLRQHKSYAEVALLLGIAERAVHDRAHAALAVLAPRQARGLEPERREEVGDYLLGQAGVAERIRTRTSLGESEHARIWAQAITAELAPLAGSTLPEIPPAPAAAAPEPPRAPAAPPSDPASGTRPIPVSEVAASLPSSSPAAPSSRLGGALLLAAIVVAVVVAVILISSGGGGSHPKKTPAASPGSTSTTGSPTDTQFPLHSQSATSRTVGVVAVLSEKGKHAFFIEAQHLPPSHGFFYAIWLYNSHTSAEALSRAPAVGSSRKLEGGAALPANAS